MHLSRRIFNEMRHSNFLLKPTYFSLTNRSMFLASSYESLVSQLSTAQSHKNLLQVYQQNKDIFKSEHIVLCLRMLGRFSKQIAVEGGQQDDTLKELTSKLNDIVQDINEFDVVDILFWMRRFKQLRLPINLKSDTYGVIYEKVNEYVQQKQFSFRNLINIFFDMQLLNRHSDLVVQEVIAQLKSDPKQLTPFSIVQILQGCSQRDRGQMGREWQLIDLVIRNLEPLLEELDIDQKSSIFKYVGQLELNLNYPAFRIPAVMYTLRSQLLEKLEQLNEVSVLNIIQAYQHLPGNFPGDLLEEIKEMVMVTLQHNAVNLKDNFLLEFVNSVTQIPRRRLDEQRLSAIQQEIGRRIESNEYLQRPNQLDRISRIFQRLPVNQELLKAISSKVSMQNGQAPFTALEYLKQNNMEVPEVIEEIVSNSELNRKLGPLATYRMSQLCPPQKSSEYVVQLEQMMNDDPEKFIYQLQQSSLNHHEIREYLQKAGKRLYEQVSEDPKRVEQSLKAIFCCIQNKESRLLWLQFLEDQKSKSFVNKFIDAFHVEDVRFDQIQFFLQFLSQNQETVNVNKLISAIKYNQQFVNEIIKNDILVRQLFSLLTSIMSKQDYRLSLIVALITRLENAGFRSQQTRQFLIKIYEHYKTNKNVETVSDSAFLNLLIKYSALSPPEAFKEFNALRQDHFDISVRTRLFSLASMNNKLDQSQVDALKTQGQSLLTFHLEKLNQDLLAKKLQSLPNLISLPPQLLQGHQTTIENTLKTNSASINERAYLQCVLALQPKYVLESRETYQSIIRELSNQYPNHNKRLHFSQLLSILEKFVKLQTKYIQLYNNFLADISNQFNYLTPEYRVRSLTVFADSHIQQIDLFKKTLEKINEQPYNFRFYLNDISQAIFQLGITDTTISELYLKFINKFDSLSSFEVLNVLSVLSIIPVDNLEAQAQRVSDFLKPDTAFQSQLNFIVTLAEFYKRTLPTSNIGQTIQKLITPQEYEERYAQIFGDKKRFMDFALDFVGSYLKSMEVEFKPKETINGLTTDIVIPAQQYHYFINQQQYRKLILVLLSQGQTNFDRTSLNGYALQKNNVYATLQNYQVIQVPFFLLKNTGNHLNRVDFLVSLGNHITTFIKSLGIHSNNTSGNYDFTHIKEAEETEEPKNEQ